MKLRTIDDVIRGLPSPQIDRLPSIFYTPREGKNLGLAVESMSKHTTDEGWQIFQALQNQGYELCGYNIGHNQTDLIDILSTHRPSTLLIQDKREWDLHAGDFREPRAKFQNVSALKGLDNIFKLTILKDAHQRPGYHRDSATEMDAHAWVVYYHPRIVIHLAPYLRPQHLIRTYHSINSDIVPSLNGPDKRSRCVLSGAVSAAYPLRSRLIKDLASLKTVDYAKHPGYHRNGCNTPAFLQMLNNYRVSICTSSMYGYSLRKIIESVACGCVVITDLPVDDVLPGIDECLVRIASDTGTREINNLIQAKEASYDFDRQSQYAEVARQFYDYRESGKRLAADIEHLRLRYRETI